MTFRIQRTDLIFMQVVQGYSLQKNVSVLPMLLQTQCVRHTRKSKIVAYWGHRLARSTEAVLIE